MLNNLTIISGASENLAGLFLVTRRCSEDVDVGSDRGELQADEALRFW